MQTKGVWVHKLHSVNSQKPLHCVEGPGCDGRTDDQEGTKFVSPLRWGHQPPCCTIAQSQSQSKSVWTSRKSDNPLKSFSFGLQLGKFETSNAKNVLKHTKILSTNKLHWLAFITGDDSRNYQENSLAFYSKAKTHPNVLKFRKMKNITFEY